MYPKYACLVSTLEVVLGRAHDGRRGGVAGQLQELFTREQEVQNELLAERVALEERVQPVDRQARLPDQLEEHGVLPARRNAVGEFFPSSVGHE